MLPSAALVADIGTWIRLDNECLVVSAGGCWPGFDLPLEPGTRWTDLLCPASQALWSTAFLPRLIRDGELDEVLLEIQRHSHPVVSHWRRNDDGWDAFWMPARERLVLVKELERARESLALMPAAVVQFTMERDRPLQIEWASDRLLDLIGIVPALASRQAGAFESALDEPSIERLRSAVAQALDASRPDWTAILTPRRWLARRVELSARRESDIWHAVLLDVTEREKLQSALRKQARTDALTRLPNRQALVEALAEQLAHGESLALFFADCDRFKHINDSLGHSVGDELLQHLAQRLRNGLRQADLRGAREDALAARLGGDEFVLLVPGLRHESEAAALAQRLIALGSQPYRLQGRQVVTSLSVGYVVAHPGDDAEALLRSADTAMHEAKRQGRGRAVQYATEMHERMLQHLVLESELREALQCNQVRAAYQPIVEIASGRVVGLEALARWRHPMRGEVPPGQFVPVAEDSGLAGLLGRYMLDRVCAQIAEWRALGVPVPERVSVNLSRAQLAEADLVKELASIVQRHGLAPSQIQFEITETLAMDGSESVNVLYSLRGLGFRLALDDFGTGHSSLASLQSIPVQQIKIDRSFVRELATSAYHRALIQAALQVAYVMELEVVAEGVEELEQAQALAELGCPRAQGWLYAKALEANDVAGYLSRGTVSVGPMRSRRASLAHPSRAHQVVVTDAKGLTTSVNSAFTLNTGYTLAEMRGKPPGQMLQGPATDPAAVRVLREAIASGVGCLGVELTNYRKDGRAFVVRLDIEPVRNESGDIVEFVSVQTEVSELWQAKEELISLRRRQDEICALGIVGFWERNLVTHQSTADPATKRLLGLEPQTPLLTWSEVLQRATPDTRNALSAYMDAVRSGGESGLVEYSIVRPDGSEADILARWTREGDRVAGVLVNVSGAERRQIQTRRLLHQLEMAAHGALQTFWSHDLDANEVWSIPSQGPLDAPMPVTYRDWLERIQPADRPLEEAAQARALLEAGSVEAEYCVCDGCGGTRVLLTRRTALRQRGDRVTHVVGVAMDVTEQRSRELQLQQLSLRHDVVLEATGLGVFRLDFRTRRLEIDRRFASIYGLPPSASSIDWVDWLQCVDPLDRERVALIEGSMRGGDELADLTFRIRRPDGERRWIATHGRAERSEDGLVVALIGAHRDVTLQQDAATLREALASERGAAESRSRLLALVVHELSNPINGMIGLAELLDQQPVRSGDGRRSNWLTLLRGAGQSAQLALSDLRELAYAGVTRSVALSDVTVSGVVQQVVGELAPRAAAASVTLMVMAPPGASVRADAGRLTQVLRNLVDNAIKYHRSEGGNVWLSAERVEGGWDLVVSDDGLGIDPQHLPHVFEEFYRAGRKDQSGSGLGLAICRAWVTAMGGTICVQHREPSGCAFTVRLASTSSG